MSDPIELADTWDVTTKTPIESLAGEYIFTSGAGLSGTATLKGDTVELHDLTIDGQPVTWQQSVTTPMRLTWISTCWLTVTTSPATPKQDGCHVRQHQEFVAAEPTGW